MTDFSESHGASQIEIRLLGTQITPASSVAKISRWHLERQEREGRSARPKRRERSRRRSQMQPSAQEKLVKTVLSLTSCGGIRQWCPGWSEHIAPSYAWQNDVKSSVYQAWQISPICRLLVEGAFVFDGTKRFHDNPQGLSVLRDAEKKGRSFRAASEQRKM